MGVPAPGRSLGREETLINESDCMSRAFEGQPALGRPLCPVTCVPHGKVNSHPWPKGHLGDLKVASEALHLPHHAITLARHRARTIVRRVGAHPCLGGCEEICHENEPSTRGCGSWGGGCNGTLGRQASSVASREGRAMTQERVSRISQVPAGRGEDLPLSTGRRKGESEIS